MRSTATASAQRSLRARAGSLGLGVVFMALAPFGGGGAAGATAGESATLGGAAVAEVRVALGGGAAWTTGELEPGSVEVRAQDPAEAVMVAAGRWVLERLPSGPAGIDPHRSGAGKDGARLQRVAAALGTELTPLDRAKECTDAIDPSTCRLSTARLLAIGAPRVQGDRAEVKVYAWYRSISGGAPVAETSWNLTLQRVPEGWRVVSEG